MMWLSKCPAYDVRMQIVELLWSGGLCFNFGLDQSNLASNTSVIYTQACENMASKLCRNLFITKQALISLSPPVIPLVNAEEGNDSNQVKDQDREKIPSATPIVTRWGVDYQSFNKFQEAIIEYGEESNQTKKGSIKQTVHIMR